MTLHGKTFVGSLVGEKGDAWHFAIVVSRFNRIIGDKLLQAAQEALTQHGISAAHIDTIWVPGAFEIPLAAQRVAATGRYHGIICLGAVIRGATTHFEHVCNAAVHGVAHVAQTTGIPTTLGILTTETLEQALDRAGGKAGNKGADAALAALEMLHVLKAIEHAS